MTILIIYVVKRISEKMIEEYTYRLNNHIDTDAHILHDMKIIELNLKEIKQFSIDDKTTFQKALVRIISHEEIHRCIQGLIGRQDCKLFDMYCFLHRETAKNI